MTDVERGRQRVIIEGVRPEVDCGRFAIKRTVDESVVVTADIFTEGHDALAAVLKYRKEGATRWIEIPMRPLGNDRWEAEFPVPELGRYQYTLEAWVDHFQSWQRDLKKRIDAGQNVRVDLQIGANMIQDAAKRASGDESRVLQEWAQQLQGGADAETLRLAISDSLAEAMERLPDREYSTKYQKELAVVVDPPRALYSTWYEFFPRSTSPEPGGHGTFKDCEARLPYVAQMGFDVLYLPPIHPIGRQFRKGKNNAPTAEPDDSGSPWAIGAKEGGHKAIHPELGTLEDFRSLVRKAEEYGIQIALDIAFQCSPDHPYVKEHPEWFRTRPDGTVQYAENPPKKYQDIYPINFETEAWQSLWDELTSVVLYWVEQGVRIFRVDNPHTKPFHFWEYLIGKVKEKHPDTIFLSEAFTRPRVMYYLGKIGFTQSYTYFSWRNTKWELMEYFMELTKTEVREYFRPNPWPNTPDILTEYLQFGGRPGFMTRLVLAATLGASYGIYGPAYELCVNQAREHGSEEYLNSEKYEIKHWDLYQPHSLSEFISLVNRARRENQALQNLTSLHFHSVDNDQLICYSKQSPDRTNTILVIVNLDPHHTQSGWVDLNLEKLDVPADHPFQVHDLLGDARYLWSGHRNYIELNPHVVPAHIFRVRKRVRTERNFEYYM